MTVTSKVWIVGAMIGAAALSGCATKGYVRDQVGLVDQKVDAQGQHLDVVDRTSHEALDRAKAAGKLAEGKFLYSMVLSDDSVKFPVDRASLSPEAQTRLTDFVNKLKADNRNVYVEIQGHTDASGTPAYNHKLGEDRAEAVRLFMNQQGVALNRLSTISYGETAPVAPNNTREGRAQNRRVVVIVLA
jgi:outer membrane protein OmpA-like peptidoglycan-associated protein